MASAMLSERQDLTWSKGRSLSRTRRAPEPPGPTRATVLIAGSAWVEGGGLNLCTWRRCGRPLFSPADQGRSGALALAHRSASAMGADLSSQRLQQLTAMGFSVEESRLALQATNGNVERAAELLLQRRRARERSQGGALAARINDFLRDQQPWNEFFGRFLWPEHLQERVSTNLLYYRANYAILTAGICGVGVLLRPALLGLVGATLGIMYVAAEWDGRLPQDWATAPLRIEQRLTAAGAVSSLLVHWTGQRNEVLRLMVLCGGVVLGHATFRARSLSARWAFFREQVEKQD